MCSGGGPSVSRRRDYYDRGYERGYDRYDDRDYYNNNRSYRWSPTFQKFVWCVCNGRPAWFNIEIFLSAGPVDRICSYPADIVTVPLQYSFNIGSVCCSLNVTSLLWAVNASVFIKLCLFVHRRRSPSPYYGRGPYRSRSRSRSYSPRKYCAINLNESLCNVYLDLWFQSVVSALVICDKRIPLFVFTGHYWSEVRLLSPFMKKMMTMTLLMT